MASNTNIPPIQNPPSGDGHAARKTSQDYPGKNQEAHYVFWISGFSKGDHEGDVLKYELTVLPEFEDAMMRVLGWKNLEESAYGDCLLTAEQIRQIAMALDVQLPTDLDLFIGVRE
ncbi:pyocin S6 family toxin immunity protein [Pseudomonas sp. 31-12]|uniref:pyocin S6 family toxin immunity protein n=1 Tax=Pseudomonas sp. 31-12 TaxID=2201356 RepID=UPI002680E28E